MFGQTLVQKITHANEAMQKLMGSAPKQYVPHGNIIIQLNTVHIFEQFLAKQLKTPNRNFNERRKIARHKMTKSLLLQVP